MIYMAFRVLIGDVTVILQSTNPFKPPRYLKVDASTQKSKQENRKYILTASGNESRGLAMIYMAFRVLIGDVTVILQSTNPFKPPRYLKVDASTQKSKQENRKYILTASGNESRGLAMIDMAFRVLIGDVTVILQSTNPFKPPRYLKVDASTQKSKQENRKYILTASGNESRGLAMI